VVLDGWPCWTLKENAHKKMRNAKDSVAISDTGSVRCGMIELELHHQVHAGDLFLLEDTTKCLGVY
jgi:uncharacterized Zn finger protein